MSLRNVAPVILEEEAERAKLEQDLEGMGCVELLYRPWTIKKEEFVHEFVMIREKQAKRSNIFDTTMQDQPEDWMARVWRAVYQFLIGGPKLAKRTDKYMEGKFLHDVNPKDRFSVKKCRDARNRRLLEFIVSIVHPDKPTQVTRTIGNIIFGALDGDNPVDWEKVFMDLVHKLVGEVGKTKPTPICPFLYHLYKSQDLLTEEEETDYRAAQELTRYRITLESEPESAHESDDEVRVITAPEQPVPQPEAQQPPQQPNRNKRIK